MRMSQARRWYQKASNEKKGVYMPNAEQVKMTFDYLRAEPRRFRMCFWGKDLNIRKEYLRQEKLSYVESKYDPPCGTVCCLAGANLIVNKQAFYDERGNMDLGEPSYNEDDEGIAGLAGKNLGIGHFAFFVSHWHYGYRYAFGCAEEALDFPQQVEITAAMLCDAYPELTEVLKPQLSSISAERIAGSAL